MRTTSILSSDRTIPKLSRRKAMFSSMPARTMCSVGTTATTNSSAVWWESVTVNPSTGGADLI